MLVDPLDRAVDAEPLVVDVVDVAPKRHEQTVPLARSRPSIKRLKTLFHGPNASGRSRQGTPVRRHHNTASMKFRSPFFAGRSVRPSAAENSAILAHPLSSSSARTIVQQMEHTTSVMEIPARTQTSTPTPPGLRVPSPLGEGERVTSATPG